MPTVVGLDLSLTSTGLAIGDETFTLQPTMKGVVRLGWIREMLLAQLCDVDDPVVCVEGYSFGSRNSQAHSAGELGGVIRLALWDAQVPFVEIPPTCRAKFATGRGNASKSEVVSAISARTGIVWSGKGADDRCDAWILQECGLSHLGLARFDWPALHLAALDKVDWSPFLDIQSS